ncbi:ATPase WRNIP1-like [Venturia canescens]|uniref:ATPase WRNIP1-like n=1 Tax=Venturia canescens TaxID=32260 RepID=UPI001C9BE354|nr:ATPase WRNIP1-like [Venturia canescens]XP_043288751.1 ATPase WRNIP1-like [Venturia canescens]XP_043288752.1 ATPase WRNIP1-like [Venturia canescens]XP_043288753.1 ATPase WRNIP1-like [Venturia canescens]XP_043288754.1 ATPase WRNIP1-like [Venturia canescens]XP_043288755.1 ATPase WRNIP1-like [Venturia canescens]XP_043288756.1 ATPase WRNIP1-like [Venturia canescens]
MAETESAQGVQCPICSKTFLPSIIEVHASKCLFLNESSENKDSQNFLKRSSSGGNATSSNSKSPGVKRAHKTVNKSNSKTATGKAVSSVSENREKSPEKLTVLNDQANVQPQVVSEVPKKFNTKNDHIPLAEKMRPTSLLGYIGQSHIMGKRSMLLQLLEKGEIPNIILWGPPGCGKTSLANVIANICKKSPNGKLRYVKLSAAMCGVAEVKESVTIATNELKFGRRTVMFMDEIHRFNKSQQDIFLPHIESGTIVLIGATTENPSFSLNSALLSRCRVLVLEKLSSANLLDILSRAVDSLNGKIHVSSGSKSLPGTSTARKSILDPFEWELDEVAKVPKFLIDSQTIEWLADTCDGDARIALGGLELAVQSIAPSDEEFFLKGPATIGLEDVKESLKKTHMLYDRKGEQHYDIISALHKSVRASDENASLYWLARMIAGGEDPVYIARRLVRMASEDIGLKDPKALCIAVDTMHGCKMLGMPECDVLLAQCVTYLAKAPKSRLMEDALRAAQRLIAEHKGPQPGVPLHLRNAPTKLMRNIGYGQGYNMKHKDQSGLNYLPEGLEDVDFFQESN